MWTQRGMEGTSKWRRWLAWWWMFDINCLNDFNPSECSVDSAWSRPQKWAGAETWGFMNTTGGPATRGRHIQQSFTTSILCTNKKTHHLEKVVSAKLLCNAETHWKQHWRQFCHRLRQRTVQLLASFLEVYLKLCWFGSAAQKKNVPPTRHSCCEQQSCESSYALLHWWQACSLCDLDMDQPAFIIKHQWTSSVWCTITGQLYQTILKCIKKICSLCNVAEGLIRVAVFLLMEATFHFIQIFVQLMQIKNIKPLKYFLLLFPTRKVIYRADVCASAKTRHLIWT